MLKQYVEEIELLLKEDKPIKKAWELSLKNLDFPIDKGVNKFLEILSDHENLFFSRNPYHNQYHLAQTVYSVGYLAKQENIKLNPDAFLLLMAATFHDADHLGRTNKVELELEKRSAYFFVQWWKNNSLFLDCFLNKKDINFDQCMDVISDLILATNFNTLSSVVRSYNNHKDFEYKTLPIYKLKQLLIEADSMMMVLPYYSLDKSRKILKETNLNLNDYQLWNFIQNFLNDFGKKTFCSDASKKLELPKLIIELEHYIKNNLNKYGNIETFNNKEFEKDLLEYFKIE